jgi:hypothetical protein
VVNGGLIRDKHRSVLTNEINARLLRHRVLFLTETTRTAGRSRGLFTLQSLEMIDVLPDDVLLEILAFYANKTKHDHARVPKVVKHGVRIAWTHEFSARPGSQSGAPAVNADHIIATFYRHLRGQPSPRKRIPHPIYIYLM